ncbi:hypothetical protein Dimus_011747 [Dionaea muscipula]
MVINTVPGLCIRAIEVIVFAILLPFPSLVRGLSPYNVIFALFLAIRFLPIRQSQILRLPGLGRAKFGPNLGGCLTKRAFFAFWDHVGLPRPHLIALGIVGEVTTSVVVVIAVAIAASGGLGSESIISQSLMSLLRTVWVEFRSSSSSSS